METLAKTFLMDVVLIKLVFLIILAVILISIIIHRMRIFLSNPFHYPYFGYSFDVSNKKNVYLEDYIDRFLIDDDNWNLLCHHQNQIEQWKSDSEEYLEKCFLKKRRTEQYESTLDDERTYKFRTYRVQTRYRQQNYQKSSYKVSVLDETMAVSWEWIEERNEELEKIGYECTLREYHSKNQRKLMTQELRRQIMERDDYTCQICGKYMPDEVGLHIDHIIPVSKGGKSVPSNLRVLCSKCNGSKGSKFEIGDDDE